MKFALVKNESLASPAKKYKVYKHVECDNNLVLLDSGKAQCLHCLKVGYMVKHA